MKLIIRIAGFFLFILFIYSCAPARVYIYHDFENFDAIYLYKDGLFVRVTDAMIARDTLVGKWKKIKDTLYVEYIDSVIYLNLNHYKIVSITERRNSLDDSLRIYLRLHDYNEKNFGIFAKVMGDTTLSYSLKEKNKNFFVGTFNPGEFHLIKFYFRLMPIYFDYKMKDSESNVLEVNINCSHPICAAYYGDFGNLHKNPPGKYLIGAFRIYPINQYENNISFGDSHFLKRKILLLRRHKRYWKRFRKELNQ